MALAPIRFPQRVIDAPCHQSPDIIGPLESIGIIIGVGGALGSDGGGAFMLLYVFTVSTMLYGGAGRSTDCSLQSSLLLIRATAVAHET